MEQSIFDYIFIEKGIAIFRQPIELLTEFDGIITGRFVKSYQSTNNTVQTAELIEVDVDEALSKSIFKSSEILIIKLTFQNEFINNQCNYSLICMYDYFGHYSKVEIKLKNEKTLVGFITLYPYPPGNYDSKITVIDLTGKTHTFSDSEILSLSLIFEHYGSNL